MVTVINLVQARGQFPYATTTTLNQIFNVINNKHPTWLLKFFTGNFSSILSKNTLKKLLFFLLMFCAPEPSAQLV